MPAHRERSCRRYWISLASALLFSVNIEADLDAWMEHEAFDFYFLAEQFNDLKFKKVNELSLSEFNRWVAYFRVKSKLEEKEIRKAQTGKKHSVEFHASTA